MLVMAVPEARYQQMQDKLAAPYEGTAVMTEEPVEQAYEVEKVFFATDCAPDEDKGGALAYSTNIQRELETGWTNVSIPYKWANGSLRKPGEMGKSTDDTSEEAATHHIILLPNQYQKYPSDPVQFFEDLKSEADARGGSRELLLFIHGYNTSFRDAVRGAAQLAYDLASDAGGYKGAVMAYDWASYNSLLRYGFLPGKEMNDDRDRAADSGERLAMVLRGLAATFPGKKLHIVAHSMGNFCLKNALDHLETDRTGSALADFRALTRTVTFAAPDVSRNDFSKMVKQILPTPGASPDAPLVTLFCSKGDLALLASSIMRFIGIDLGYRAGLFRAWFAPFSSGHRVHPVLLPGQIDTVDASGFATDGFGHGYFSDNESLLTEISKIINHGQVAEARLQIQPVSLAPHTDCRACLKWYKMVQVPAKPRQRAARS